MIRRPYPTPDSPPSGVEYEWIAFRVPKLSIIRRVLRGALVYIGYITTWTQEGDMTEFQTSQLVKEMTNSMSVVNWMLGLVVPITHEVIPDNLIIADGRTVNRADYPDLWENLPAGSKTATTLTVPDLRDKFILGATSTLVSGETGGQSEVTLDINQIPSHVHTYTSPTFGIDIITAGVPDPTGVGNPPVPLQTTPVGGGLPHPNMPPYYTLVYCVVGRF